jgi:hypothetical protein
MLFNTVSFFNVFVNLYNKILLPLIHQFFLLAILNVLIDVSH